MAFAEQPRCGRRFRFAAALQSGSVASLLSTAAVTWRSAVERRRAAAGTNATSQWLWGRRARLHLRADLGHTATGYAIHHAASVFWALAFEAWRRDRREAPARTLGRACAISALACFVDYRLTPTRLTPGFEAHLSRRSMLLVYAAFAAGLAAPALARAARERRWRGGHG
jgi:hypothetical protein